MCAVNKVDHRLLTVSLEKGELPEAGRARGDRLDHMGAAAAQLQLSPARRGHCWHVQREEFKRSRLPAAKRSRARLGRCGRFLASKDCLYHAEYAGHTLTCSTLKIQPRRRPAWSVKWRRRERVVFEEVG